MNRLLGFIPISGSKQWLAMFVDVIELGNWLKSHCDLIQVDWDHELHGTLSLVYYLYDAMLLMGPYWCISVHRAVVQFSAQPTNS